MISLHEGARAVRPRKSGDRALVLRLAVAGSQPEVWRRLLVRESLWLSRLHDGIIRRMFLASATVGWEIP
jgi:hypothetical protein